jgi:hypothetical protein
MIAGTRIPPKGAILQALSESLSKRETSMAAFLSAVF